MRLGQLVECDMRIIFLEYRKCGGETIPRTISENSKLSIVLDV